MICIGKARIAVSLLISLFGPTLTHAHFDLLETYQLSANSHYQHSTALTPLAGAALIEGHFLRNIFFHTPNDSALGELARALFHSVDGQSLAPSQSQSSLSHFLIARSVGAILYATTKLESELHKVAQMEEAKNKDHHRDLLVEQMVTILQCENSFDQSKIKQFLKADRNPDICPDKNQRVSPQIAPFLQSVGKMLEDKEQQDNKNCFPQLSRSHLRAFFKIYLKALTQKPIKNPERWQQWQQIPLLPQKILLALFAKKAQASERSVTQELTDLYQGQFHTQGPLIHKKFSLQQYDQLKGLPSQSLTDEEAFFIEVYEGRTLSTRPPLGSYITTTYETAEHEQVNFADCGETSILNFLNSIFRDSNNQRVTPALYEGKIKWSQSLLDYYEKKERAYDQIPSATDHADFAKVVSALKDVHYLRPKSLPIPVCELNAGVENVLHVLENLMNLQLDPKYPSLLTKQDKLDFIFQLLERPGFTLGWKIEGDPHRKTINTKDTGLRILISINGQDSLRWFFGSGHFTLTEIENGEKKKYLKSDLPFTSPYYPQLQKRSQLIFKPEDWIFQNLADNETKKGLLLQGLLVPTLSPVILNFFQSLPVDDPIPNLIRWSYLQQFSQQLTQEQKLLLQAQIKTYSPTDEFSFGVNWAAQNGQHKIVELILAARDHEGQLLVTGPENFGTAIKEAATNGHSAILTLLLAARDDHNRLRVNATVGNNFPIYMAAKNGHELAVAILLAARDDKQRFRVNPNHPHNHPLEVAARNGQTAVVKLLLAARDDQGNFRVDAAFDENTPLRTAVDRGQYEVVRILLAAKDDQGRSRVDPADHYNSAVIIASTLSDPGILNLLLAEKEGAHKFRVDPAAEDNFCIRSTLLEGRYELAQALLAARDHQGKLRVDPSGFDFKLKRKMMAKQKKFILRVEKITGPLTVISIDEYKEIHFFDLDLANFFKIFREGVGIVQGENSEKESEVACGSFQCKKLPLNNGEFLVVRKEDAAKVVALLQL